MKHLIHNTLSILDRFKFQLSVLLLLAISPVSFSQIIVGQYTGIDHATNYTNPSQGNACGNMAAINLSIGDADFVNGSAEVPLGWSFSGTWASGASYMDGPGSEVLLVSLHTYTEAWHVALRLSNGTTTAFQSYNLTIITTNATGSLTHCGGIVNNFNYERPSQELDFASYAIPAGVGVIGIVFEPFADGAANPDPHGVIVLQNTPIINPCGSTTTVTDTICQGDSTLFQGSYYNSTGLYYDSLLTAGGCDSVHVLDLTVGQTFLNSTTQSICSADSVLFQGNYYNTSGIYYDSLQTNFGCDSVYMLDLTVNPEYSFTTTQTICDGNSVLFQGVNYTTTGVYTTNLLTTEGCDSTYILDLTVLPSYQTNVDLFICQGDSVFAQGAYQTSSGVYTDSLLSVQSCDSIIITTLTVNPLPIIDAGVDQIVCDGVQITLSGSGGTSYVWDNGVIDNIAFNPPLGTTTFEVTGTDANGCQNTDQVDVLVNALPSVNAGADQTVCQGVQVTLAGSGNATSYAWDGGVVDNVAFNPPVGTTTFEVTGTDANGCQSTDQVVVVVNATPNIGAGADQVVCEGDQVTLSGTGGVSYSWDGGVTDGLAFTPVVGTTTYTVIGTDANGCQSSDQIDITVDALPIVTFTGSPLEGCSPLDVQLVNTTAGSSVDCIWTISDGTTVSGCGTVNAQIFDPGYHDVTLTILTPGGCFASATATDYIYIEPDPVAAFTFPTSEFSVLDPEIQFTNQTTGASTYWWNFNDGSAGTNVTDPTHVFPDEAVTYTIDLVAYSDLGCIDSATASIYIQEELIYYIPNSFSPDGDEFNNVFLPVFYSGFDPYSYELRIFNRWGEVIFQSNDANIGWDGTYQGKLVQDGTYTWAVKFKAKYTDEFYEDHGHVNMLR